jgi:hypothetical protein
LFGVASYEVTILLLLRFGVPKLLRARFFWTIMVLLLIVFKRVGVYLEVRKDDTMFAIG